LCFFLPWIFFLFVGGLDLGFYCYALVSVESAARSAALYASQGSGTAGSSTGACAIALAELQYLPNVPSTLTTCTANPVTVTATAVTGPDGQKATQVSVAYQSIQLIPIPGLLAGQFTWTRTIQMRLQS
jgi:hypothetical protein